MKRPSLLKMIERVEGHTAARMSRALREPKLVGAMMSFLELGMRGRQLAQGLGGRAAAFWGLPSAAQVRDNLELLARIEERLAELELRLEEER